MRSFMRHRRTTLGGSFDDTTDTPLDPMLLGNGSNTPLTSPVLPQPPQFTPNYSQQPQYPQQQKQLPKKLLTPIRNLFGQRTPPDGRKPEPRRYSDENYKGRLRPLSFLRVVLNDSSRLAGHISDKRLPLTYSPSFDDDQITKEFSRLPRATRNKGFEVIKAKAPALGLATTPGKNKKKYTISGPIGPPRSTTLPFESPRDAPEPPLAPLPDLPPIDEDKKKKKKKKKRRLKPPIQFDSSKPLPPIPQPTPKSSPEGRTVPPTIDLVELNFRSGGSPTPSKHSVALLVAKFPHLARTDASESCHSTTPDNRSVRSNARSTRTSDNIRTSIDSRLERSMSVAKKVTIAVEPPELMSPIQGFVETPSQDPFSEEMDLSDDEYDEDLDSSQFSFIKDNIGGRNTSVKYYKTHNPAKDMPTPPVVVTNTFNENDLGYEVDDFSDYDYENNGGYDDGGEEEVGYNDALGIDDGEDEVGYNDALGFDDDDEEEVGYNDALEDDVIEVGEHDGGEDVDDRGVENKLVDDDDDEEDYDNNYDDYDEDEYDVPYNDVLDDQSDDYDVSEYAEFDKPPLVGDGAESLVDRLYKLKDEEKFVADDIHHRLKIPVALRMDLSLVDDVVSVPDLPGKNPFVGPLGMTPPPTATTNDTYPSLEPPPRILPQKRSVSLPELSLPQRSPQRHGDGEELLYGDDILENYLDMSKLPTTDVSAEHHHGGRVVLGEGPSLTPLRTHKVDGPSSPFFPPSVAGSLRGGSLVRRRGLAPDASPWESSSHHQLFLMAANHGDDEDLPLRKLPAPFKSFHDLILNDINVVEKVQEFESFAHHQRHLSQDNDPRRNPLVQLTILEISMERYPRNRTVPDHEAGEMREDRVEDRGEERRSSVSQMMALLGSLELTIDRPEVSTAKKRKLILEMKSWLSQVETQASVDHRLLIIAMMLTLDAIGQRLDDDDDKIHHLRSPLQTLVALKRDLILNMMSTLALLDFSLPPEEAAANEVQLRKRKLEKHYQASQPKQLERNNTNNTVLALLTLTLDPHKRYLWYDDHDFYSPYYTPLVGADLPLPVSLPQTPVVKGNTVLEDLGEDLLDEINQLPADFDFDEHERSSQVLLPMLSFFRLNLYKNKPLKVFVDTRVQLNKIETTTKTVTFYKKANGNGLRLRLISRATSLRLQNSFALVTEEDEGDDNTGLWRSHDLPPLPFTLDPKYTYHHNLLGGNLDTIAELAKILHE